MSAVCVCVFTQAGRGIACPAEEAESWTGGAVSGTPRHTGDLTRGHGLGGGDCTAVRGP